MPENEKTETKLEKFEREQMSRRAALRKMGYTSALATLAMFGVDDVVRLVGQKMQMQARNNQVANIVAQEFANSGIALASPSTCQECYNVSFCGYATCNTCTQPGQPGANQEQCYNQVAVNFNACIAAHCTGGATGSPPPANYHCPACAQPAQ
jgi:hypothetical protein